MWVRLSILDIKFEHTADSQMILFARQSTEYRGMNFPAFHDNQFSAWIARNQIRRVSDIRKLSNNGKSILTVYIYSKLLLRP